MVDTVRKGDDTNVLDESQVDKTPKNDIDTKFMSPKDFDVDLSASHQSNPLNNFYELYGKSLGLKSSIQASEIPEELKMREEENKKL